MAVDSFEEVREHRKGIHEAVISYMNVNNLEFKDYLRNETKIMEDFDNLTRHVKIKNTDRYL